jgi:hypothetical protein
MTKPRLSIGLALVTVLLAVIALATGSAAAQDFDDRLDTITDGFRFDFVRWEINTFDNEILKFFRGGPEISEDDTAEVIEYFENVTQIKKLETEIAAVIAGTGQGDRPGMEDERQQRRQTNAITVERVEGIIEAQIREALNENGINSPFEKYGGSLVKFPPVNFVISRPPHLLVISPRDKIESIREVALLPEMTIEQMEKIEAEADKLGVSSLVVRLGGIATYPNFVSDTGSLQFILSTACEEWLHQYLAFTPLGFRYLLDLTGIKRDYEIATMNETVAGMVSKEIGTAIYDEYYAGKSDEGSGTVISPEFDFNREMREIRRAVDKYLADGEISVAEEFMEMKRQYLAENGYYIRKLNQAYFAFHGAYADAPTSVSPIGTELGELRSQSSTLKMFLETAASMTGREDLLSIVQ